MVQNASWGFKDGCLSDMTKQSTFRGIKTYTGCARRRDNFQKNVDNF